MPEAMGRLAEQIEQQGHRLTQFAERYKVYRQKKQELESDPEAPQGFSAFVGKAIAKGGLGLAKQIPGSGAVTPFLDEEAISSQAGEWTSYVAKKLTNKDEARLINEPIETLTPVFLQDLGKVAESHPILLLFDVYERTSPFLDTWLNQLLEGHHGDLPPTLLMAIAGREELDKNRWADWEGIIARLPLDPFTQEEATQFLHRKGITHEQVIDVILRLSGCLLLLVATLAAESPNDPAQIGDPSGTAVERFLQWVEDPTRRQLALDAALPRTLNRDIIAVLQGEENADKLFNWLRTMPFVEETTDGWAYHDIARTQMLRHKRRLSPQSWADLHGKLAAYYEQLRTNLGLEEKPQWSDTTWQSHSLHHLYHHLCQAPQRHLPTALNTVLAALNNKYKFAQQWAETISQAGKDTEANEVNRWGDRLLLGCAPMYMGQDKNKEVVSLFTDLLEYPELDEKWRVEALCRRGSRHRLLRQHEKALADYDENPDNHRNSFNLALYHLAAGLIKQAWHFYRDALQRRAPADRIQAAICDLEDFLHVFPGHEWAIKAKTALEKRLR
jgi:tetratricopeptide (TPR) repeat protein